MVKKTNVDNGEFKFDNGLDFELDGFDMFDQSKSKKKRSPIVDVVKGAGAGVKSKLKSGSFWDSLARKALPRSYSVLSDEVKASSETLADIYRDTAKTLKPELSKVGRQIDALVPEESKRLKRLTSKFKPDSEPSYSAPSAEGLENQAIGQAQAEIFDKIRQHSDSKEARDRVEARIQEKVDTKRFTTSVNVLKGIYDGISTISSYTTSVNASYQKKSLELQFRSYFVQAELLKSTSKYNDLFKNYFEAIKHNTALPDYVKITSYEMLKKQNMEKLVSYVGSKMSDGFKRLRKKVGVYTEGVKEALFNMGSGLDMADQFMESQKMAREAGVDESIFKTGGEVGTGFLADWLVSRYGDKLRKFFPAEGRIAKGVAKASRFAQDPGSAIKRARQSESYQKWLSKRGIMGGLINTGDLLLDSFIPPELDEKIREGNKLGELKHAHFDSRVYKSITEVIPGYLAGILQEQTRLRTGQDADLLGFDYHRERFTSQRGMKDKIIETLKDKSAVKTSNWQLDEVVKGITGQELQGEEAVNMKQYLHMLGENRKIDYADFDPTQTTGWNKLTKKNQKLILEGFAKHRGTDEGKFLLTELLNVSRKGVEDQVEEARAHLNAMIENGQGAILEQLGIVKESKDGGYEFNLPLYLEFIRQTGLTEKGTKEKKKNKWAEDLAARGFDTRSRKEKKADNEPGIGSSDRNVKTRIKTKNQKNVLDQLDKLTTYQYQYRPELNDGYTHQSYMAQDVHKAFGENAAPGGVKVDFKYMSTVHTDAINQLHQNQQNQLKDPTAIDLLRSIDQRLADISSLYKVTDGLDPLISGVKQTYGDTVQRGKYYARLMNRLAKKNAKKLKNKAQPHLDKIKEEQRKYQEDPEAYLNDLKAKAQGKAKEAQDKVQQTLNKAHENIPTFGLRGLERIKGWTGSLKNTYAKGRELFDKVKSGEHLDKIKNSKAARLTAINVYRAKKGKKLIAAKMPKMKGKLGLLASLAGGMTGFLGGRKEHQQVPENATEEERQRIEEHNRQVDEHNENIAKNKKDVEDKVQQARDKATSFLSNQKDKIKDSASRLRAWAKGGWESRLEEMKQKDAQKKVERAAESLAPGRYKGEGIFNLLKNMFGLVSSGLGGLMSLLGGGLEALIPGLGAAGLIGKGIKGMAELAGKGALGLLRFTGGLYLKGLKGIFKPTAGDKFVGRVVGGAAKLAGQGAWGATKMIGRGAGAALRAAPGLAWSATKGVGRGLGSAALSTARGAGKLGWMATKGIGKLGLKTATSIGGGAINGLLGRTLIKGGAKQIPILGTALGLGLAANRAFHGDWAGAGLEALSTIPGFGIPAIAGLAALDLKRAHDKKQTAENPVDPAKAATERKLLGYLKDKDVPFSLKQTILNLGSSSFFSTSNMGTKILDAALLALVPPIGIIKIAKDISEGMKPQENKPEDKKPQASVPATSSDDKTPTPTSTQAQIADKLNTATASVDTSVPTTSTSDETPKFSGTTYAEEVLKKNRRRSLTPANDQSYNATQSNRKFDVASNGRYSFDENIDISPGAGNVPPPTDQTPGTKQEVLQAIETYSQPTGVPANDLKTIAAVESGLRPNVGASTSSAKGLYQFTNGTWKATLNECGSKYGLTGTESPCDVRASTFMAGELLKTNAKAIRKVKPNPNLTDIYMAHFLGPAGARKFLSANPNANASELLPQAAAANRPIFFNGGRPRTVGEIYTLMGKKLESAAKRYNAGDANISTSFDGNYSSSTNVAQNTSSYSSSTDTTYQAPQSTVTATDTLNKPSSTSAIPSPATPGVVKTSSSSNVIPIRSDSSYSAVPAPPQPIAPPVPIATARRTSDVSADRGDTPMKDLVSVASTSLDIQKKSLDTMIEIRDMIADFMKTRNTQPSEPPPLLRKPGQVDVIQPVLDIRRRRTVGV